MYGVVVLLHVLGAFAFVMAHGVSMLIAFRLGGERDRARQAHLLELSGISVDDVRSAVAAQWYFTVDETYRLFELGVAAALHGDRPTPDDWPPRYSSWTGSDG